MLKYLHFLSRNVQFVSYLQRLVENDVKTDVIIMHKRCFIPLVKNDISLHQSVTQKFLSNMKEMQYLTCEEDRVKYKQLITHAFHFFKYDKLIPKGSTYLRIPLARSGAQLATECHKQTKNTDFLLSREKAVFLPYIIFRPK